MEVKVRGTNFDDIDRIVEIEKICFTLPWSKEAFTKELFNDLAYYQCATADETIVGYMGMWKICDEGHITNIAVLPQFRNKGIASLMINKMIEICICSEINSMTLEVRETNVNARKLYEKFGFESVGIRPNYYQQPKENAVIMWKKVQYNY